MKYFCCDDDRRRTAVKEHGILNGIDFLEVSDDPADPFDLRQRILFVHLLKDVAAGWIQPDNVRIEGGERIRNIKVLRVSGGVPGSPPGSSPPEPGNVLEIEVSDRGDFSTYTLRLLENAAEPELGPPHDFDQLLSAVDFSFKVRCASDFDCKVAQICPPVQQRDPDLNYLAKDYASFRQLMLDRMSVLAPGWAERNAADLGIALVELLAYVGDYLSYQQDAVATEAYLGTARRRVSVKRHARLVDYFMHEGSTARAWIRAVVAPGIHDVTLLKTSAGFTTRIATKVRDVPPVLASTSRSYQQVLIDAPEVFELVNEIALFHEHNEMPFYTWGARACCLPKGATRATLRGAFPALATVLARSEPVLLVFAEVRGPLTGAPEDADPVRRQAVRLTRATVTEDRLGGRFKETPDDDPVPITEIEWHADDALAFPFCISSGQGTTVFEDVTVAWGNIALADFGSTQEQEELPQVPPPDPVLVRVAAPSGDRCTPAPLQPTARRFRPRLARGPVTQVAGYDLDRPATSGRSVMRNAAKRFKPAVVIRELTSPFDEWRPQRDLLASAANKKEFVVDVENDGTAYLRFGDDRFGARPAAGSRMAATYRVGNGTAGNVGRNALVHLISDQPEVVAGAVERITNPLPAAGGMEPESLEEVRQRAPSAFRVQERAVTPADYGEKARACRSDVQRAAATFRWTGSWRTVFVTVDRFGAQEVDEEFRDDLRECLERVRMAGHDLNVDAPVFVPLELEMLVCVGRDYFATDVRRALLALFNNRLNLDGRKGLFHPDNFSFGEPVYLSSFYAAAQSVAGVERVAISRFQRVDHPETSGVDSGRIEMAPLEIARLDNDRNFPERGLFTLAVEGGR